jgi:predicted site-specific integrase-resolvase
MECESHKYFGINSNMESTNNYVETSREGTAGGPKLAFPGSMEPYNRLVKRKDAQSFLGVCYRTLLRYEESGKLHPVKNRINGRIMYQEAEVLAVLGSKLNQKKEVLMYCRTAVLGSTGPKGRTASSRLAEQVDRLSSYCVHAGIKVDEVLTDLGPGNGSRRLPGLDRLIEKVLRHKVSLLVIETPDRLARWGLGDMMDRFLAWHGVEVHVASPVLTRDEYREEVKQDLAEVLLEAKKLLGERIDNQ